MAKISNISRLPSATVGIMIISSICTCHFEWSFKENIGTLIKLAEWVIDRGILFSESQHQKKKKKKKKNQGKKLCGLEIQMIRFFTVTSFIVHQCVIARNQSQTYSMKKKTCSCYTNSATDLHEEITWLDDTPKRKKPENLWAWQRRPLVTPTLD